jgi:Tol biopolymer transport system component/aminoglycoside phosphotransferase (APT) family kinase protein
MGARANPIEPNVVRPSAQVRRSPTLIGQTLAHCRITAAIGSGGMGEVYRATDTRLGREVAIKLLPKAVASDPERLARFEREARVLAAINHTSIAHVYGFEAARLEDGTAVHLIVMELVEGEDLAERLRRGSIPVDEALAIAKQIAEALEEAHEKGIVHRDLKPANVKLTPGGKVKVLDFGLAKAWAGDAAGATSSADLSQSPTLAHTGTAAGLILGTAAYMSPEQARGKPVDRRADIWAFGVVVYEMLTGRRLFGGETVSDVLAAVLTREPDWTALPAGTPPTVRRLLGRCLDRDPRRRLRDIGEAVVLLADPAAADWSPEPAASARATSRERVAWVAAALALAVAAALAGRGLSSRSGSTPPGPLHFSLSLAPSDIAPTGAVIAPDGLRVAFAGHVPGADTAAIFVRSLHEAAARPLSGTEGATSAPVFSPDGRWIAFISDYHALRKVPIEGGAAATLVEGNLRYAEPTWTDNGKILLARFDPDQPGVIYELPEAGGRPTPVVGRPEQATEAVVSPEALPGGRLVLLRVAGARPALAVQSLETGERRVLAQDARFARSVGRSIVWMENGRLVGAPLDPARLAFSRAPAAIPTDGLDAGPSPTALDVSASGSLVFMRGATTEAGLVWIDRGGTKTRATTREGICFDPRLSPDGARVAVQGASGGKDDADVWTVDLRRGTLSRFTFGAGEDETAVWSPDGAWIAWASERAGEGRSLYRRRSDGSGAEERLWISDGRHFHADSWTPDGKGILVTLDDPKAGWDVYLITLGPKPSAKPLLRDSFNEASPRVSPDGRWIIYVSDESGRNEVYAQAFPDLGRKVQVSVAGGTEPIWHPRGGEIVYRSATSRDFMSVAVQARETLVLSPPRVLVSDAGMSRGTPDHTYFDVAPDGRLLASEAQPADARAELHIILGWAQAAGLLR